MHPSALAALDCSPLLTLQHGMHFQDLLASVLFPLLGMRFPSPSIWRTPQLRLSSIAFISGNPVPSSMVTAVLCHVIVPVLQLDCALFGSRDSVWFFFCTVAPNPAHRSLLNKYSLFDLLATRLKKFIVVINVYLINSYNTSLEVPFVFIVFWHSKWSVRCLALPWSEF